MENIIHFEPLTKDTFDTYIQVGTKAYNQHYLHLWPNKDSKTYIESSFTKTVLKKEEKDANTQLFVIHFKKKSVGILKITLDSALHPYTSAEAVLIDKIYILNEYSGRGIGKKVLEFVALTAKEMHKKILWLDTMQKGPALHFYLKNGFEIHSETSIPFENAIEKEKPMYIMMKEI